MVCIVMLIRTAIDTLFLKALMDIIPPRLHSKRVMQGPRRREEVPTVMQPDRGEVEIFRGAKHATESEHGKCDRRLVTQYVAMYCPTIYRVQVRTKVSTMKGEEEPALRLQTGKCSLEMRSDAVNAMLSLVVAEYHAMPVL